MFDTDTVGDFTPDTLEQLIISGETAIARIRAIQSQALKALDTAQTAQADGCRNLTDWVSSRLDIGHDTATSLVTAARSMPDNLAHELADGLVSFDRAIAETRLHRSGAATDTILSSRGLDLAGVRRLAARHRRIHPKDERQSFLNQNVTIQPSLSGDGWNLWAILEGFEGRLVEKALYARADELNTGDGGSIPPGLRMALALASICQDSLEGYAIGGVGSEPIVTITADATLVTTSQGQAGAEITGGPRIGPQALAEMICLGKTELNTLDTNGNILGIGPTTSAIAPRLRRAILARDGACTIDGCQSRAPYPQAGPFPRRFAPRDKPDPKSITSSNAPTAAATTPQISPPCVGSTTTSSSTGEDSASIRTPHPDDADSSDQPAPTHQPADRRDAFASQPPSPVRRPG